MASATWMGVKGILVLLIIQGSNAGCIRNCGCESAPEPCELLAPKCEVPPPPSCCYEPAPPKCDVPPPPPCCFEPAPSKCEVPDCCEPALPKCKEPTSSRCIALVLPKWEAPLYSSSCEYEYY